MRSTALLDKVLEDSRCKYGFYERIELGDRIIFERICDIVSHGGGPGEFHPDATLDGDLPLASLVAIWSDVRDIELVARGLERLCDCGLIGVTSEGGILLPSILERRAHPSAVNGRMSIGRRRKRESAKAYAARARAYRSARKRVDLAAEAADNLRVLELDCVTGAELARVLRESRLAMAPDSSRNHEVCTSEIREQGRSHDPDPEAGVEVSASICAENTEIDAPILPVENAELTQEEERGESEPLKEAEPLASKPERPTFDNVEDVRPLGEALKSLGRMVSKNVVEQHDSQQSSRLAQNSGPKRNSADRDKMSAKVDRFHSYKYRDELEEFLRGERNKTHEVNNRSFFF